MREEIVDFLVTDMKISPKDKAASVDHPQEFYCDICWGDVGPRIIAEDERINGKAREIIEDYCDTDIRPCPVCLKKNQLQSNNLYNRADSLAVDYEKRHHNNKKRNIAAIEKNGYIVVGPYVSEKVDITVIRANCCGREFSSLPAPLKIFDCPICVPCEEDLLPDEKIRAPLTDFEKYSHQVRSLSEATYRTYYKRINPMNLERGRSEGKYELDHILSIRSCYDNGVPTKLCAHQDNLQMLTWEENASKHTTMPINVPNIFESYLQPQ